MILLGIVSALLIAEGALRVMPLPSFFTFSRLLAQQWEADEELLLRLKPDLDLRIRGHPEFSYTVRTNGAGLRDEPLLGTFDVAAIGDSFTFGFGVEADESWPNRLEAVSDLRVVNLGWAGWCSYVYPAAIRRYAIPSGARVWLWTFFVNDLAESAGAEAFQRLDEPDFREWVMREQFDFADPPFPYSLRTVQAVVSLTHPGLGFSGFAGDRVYDDGQLRMHLNRYAWDMSDPSKHDVERGWELTEIALREARDLAVAHGADLIVIWVPSREHVYWPDIQEQMTDVDVQQLDDAEARLAAICAAAGIDYFSLLPGLREQSSGSDLLYFAGDGHWNAQGHDAAARLVYAYLGQTGRLDAH
jgi:hypothetical protein